MAWVAGYFSWGITLFNERIAASTGMQTRLSLGSLERDLPQDRWLQLAFHALPDGSMAFRESFAPSFGLRYFPVMRGRVHARRHEVRVIGLCSWFVASCRCCCCHWWRCARWWRRCWVLPLFLASYRSRSGAMRPLSRPCACS
jgi:hypothetical protein